MLDWVLGGLELLGVLEQELPACAASTSESPPSIAILRDAAAADRDDESNDRGNNDLE